MHQAWPLITIGQHADAMKDAIPRLKGSGCVKFRHSNEDVDQARETMFNTGTVIVNDTMEYPHQSVGKLFLCWRSEVC
jgi:hypothetical protein